MAHAQDDPQHREIPKGARIRFLVRLGTLLTRESRCFSGAVDIGDEGIYLGRLRTWHLAQAPNGTYFPLNMSQFERT